MLDAALGAGECEQGVDQALGVLAVDEQLFEDRLQVVGDGRPVRQCLVDEDPLGGQRGPQFVRSVGDEPALAGDGDAPAEEVTPRAQGAPQNTRLTRPLLTGDRVSHHADLESMSGRT